jgi:hypothetical protein
VEGGSSVDASGKNDDWSDASRNSPNNTINCPLAMAARRTATCSSVASASEMTMLPGATPCTVTSRRIVCTVAATWRRIKVINDCSCAGLVNTVGKSPISAKETFRFGGFSFMAVVGGTSVVSGKPVDGVTVEVVVGVVGVVVAVVVGVVGVVVTVVDGVVVGVVGVVVAEVDGVVVGVVGVVVAVVDGVVVGDVVEAVVAVVIVVVEATGGSVGMAEHTRLLMPVPKPW